MLVPKSAIVLLAANNVGGARTGGLRALLTEPEG